MSIKLVQDRLDSYNCKSSIDEDHAIREITQEVALAALGRTDFFKHAAFQGGTCLRIFYGLNRFSEDMDFILKEANRDFALQPHLQAVCDELKAYGYDVEVADRSRTDVAVRKAFLKDDSLGKDLQLQYADKSGPLKKIRIRFEVDTNPPSGSGVEIKYVDFPFVSSVTVQDKPSLFAGKLHALLCRGYVKGRDWYDFLWYTSQDIGINYEFLSSALKQQGPWQNEDIEVDLKWCLEHLGNKVRSVDWGAAREDVRRFVKATEQPSLGLWSKELFLSQVGKIRR
ncbi:MAG: nucleotidyl transferase AbiEii/AbiGii toxin family protein [Deltaproteobacteria bacterium]|nr:nucleotidyl transferase AbiEii/AbiGii toxin family protein [Deltaproteobacteria bacterium]